MSSFIDLDNVSVLFELRRRRVRRKLLSGNSVGGRIVNFNRLQHVLALDGITLTASPGERISLSGHNGAGKTTLLRTIAGIYEAQKGHSRVRGRISTLFSNAVALSDYETGRQNLEITGLLRGLTVSEIRARLPEVVEMSEIGEYLDEPLTSYSAGMKTRLGIAMATISRPDILLIDEVLTTSDRYMIDLMKNKLDVFTRPDTIIIISSHSKDLNKYLCNRHIVLNSGTIVSDITE